MGAMLPSHMRVAAIERSISALDALARLRGRENQPRHLATGVRGEDAAFFHLLRSGYTVVARRWSAGNVPGDVDLIAWQGELLCFFEVKARTARDMTPAEQAVDSHKRNVLRRLARAYLRQLPQSVPTPARPNVRFDVISVYLLPGKEPAIHHFQDSFGWQERFDRY
jgi:putative endonuclease